MATEQYPQRRDPKILIAGIVVVTVIVIASIAIITAPRPKFIVYTYDSFMVWGDEPNTIDERAFGAFERQYGVDVEIVRLNMDANGIVARLKAESSNPVADIVIGIDNILILQEGVKDVLEPYTPENISFVDNDLINALDPEHYIVPFDFGLVTIIYSSDLINTTTHPELADLTFTDLATPELASGLVTENPQFSSPGLAFLLTQIAVYEKLMGEDWTQWWQSVKDHIDVQPGWSEAWAKWDSDPTISMMVSYGTDPAYSAWATGAAPTTAIAPIHHNGTTYAWVQVEGIGLVKNGPNSELAKAFIDYCLSNTVQELIPLNQWMFPASSHATLPAVYDYAIHPDEVSLLNTILTRNEIEQNLTAWLDDWAAIMTG